MAGERIPLGTASTGVLVPDIGSQIQTDQFGIDSGVIRHSLGNQSGAHALRPAAGDLYDGTLPQFAGFFADGSGITGRDGNASYVDVVYRKRVPNWPKIPVRTHDSESHSFQITQGDPSVTYTYNGMTVRHPVLTYRFSVDPSPVVAADPDAPVGGGGPAVDPQLLGTYLASPPHAPVMGDQTIRPFVTIGNFIAGQWAWFEFHFKPNTLGWECIKNDVTPLCGGKIYAVDQQWKLTYYQSGYTLLDPPA